MHFECCYKCKAPKRHPGCHDHCEEYAEARAKLDALKAEESRQRAIRQGVHDQQARNVERALKKKRRYHKRGGSQ